MNPKPEALARSVVGCRSRRSLFLMLFPILLVGSGPVFSLAARNLVAPLAERPFGSMTRSQAREYAAGISVRLTGAAARAGEATAVELHPHPLKGAVRVWDVTCETASGQQVIRFDAHTRAVRSTLGVAKNSIQRRAAGCPWLCDVKLLPERGLRVERAFRHFK